MKTWAIYFSVKSFIMWQVFTHGPIAVLMKGALESILGYELTWN